MSIAVLIFNVTSWNSQFPIGEPLLLSKIASTFSRILQQ